MVYGGGYQKVLLLLLPVDKPHLLALSPTNRSAKEGVFH